MRRRCATGLLSALVVAGLVCAPASAAASPDDDYREASAAYRRGDMNTAIKTLQRGSDTGHIPSMLLLAYLFEQASLDSQAVAVYRKATAAGSTDGAVGLAGMVAAGKDGARHCRGPATLRGRCCAGQSDSGQCAGAGLYQRNPGSDGSGARQHQGDCCDPARRRRGYAQRPMPWHAPIRG